MKLISQEANVDVNHYSNIYDLKLYQTSQKDYIVEVSMNLLFKFVGVTDEKGVEQKADQNKSADSWTEKEKLKFISNWQSSVKSKWQAARFNHKNGKFISVYLKFNIKHDAVFADSHWEILVRKLPKNASSATSFVWRDRLPGKFDVLLDENDNIPKANIGDRKQTGAAHEFGHMLGLGDEYGKHGTKAERKDTHSIMNKGSRPRVRHYNNILDWAKPKLSEWEKMVEKSQKTLNNSSRIFK